LLLLLLPQARDMYELLYMVQSATKPL
jgi:hypothetical protein